MEQRGRTRMSINIPIGELLRLKRVDRQKTLSEIAEMVGVSINYISELEKGSKSNPSDEIIVKLSEIYNINEDDLFMAFNRIPLSARKELELYPSLIKALSELNNDDSIDYKKKEEFYNKLVYWYKKMLSGK
jgi:transcriptional regulator with XRE-family HTH domain